MSPQELLAHAGYRAPQGQAWDAHHCRVQRVLPVQQDRGCWLLLQHRHHRHHRAPRCLQVRRRFHRWAAGAGAGGGFVCGEGVGGSGALIEDDAAEAVTNVRRSM